MRSKKLEQDPNQILNPMKFFHVRTRFSNALGILFKPTLYGALLHVLCIFSPIVGIMSRLFGGKRENKWSVPKVEEENGHDLLIESSIRCAFCGACVSVCPAYILRHDELATARAKLKIAEAILSKDEIRLQETSRIFQCLHCGLCEEVCQTRLPLKDCYAALEALVEKRYGRPVETIERFVELVNKNRTWIESAFGLDLAQWSPTRPAVKISKASQPSERNSE